MATITAAVAGGNWSVGASWVGSAAPGSGDDVLLTATSGNISLDLSTNACRSIDCTGYTGTLTFGAGFTLSVGDGSGGAVKFVAGMTLTDSAGILKLVSTSNNGGTGWSITTGGKVLPITTVDGVSGKWVFQDAFSEGVTQLTLTNGALFTNGKTVTAGVISSSTSNTRTLDITSSTITVSVQNAWQSSVTTGMTFTSTSSTLNITNSASAAVFGSLAFATVVISGFGSAQITSTGSFVNLTFTGGNSLVAQMSLNNNAGFTVTGTLTVGGSTTQGAKRLRLLNATVGTTYTITMTGAAVVIAGDINFQDITLSGSPSWTNSGARFVGDCGGNNSLITTNRTTPATQTATGTASFTWSTHGWTSRVPLPQDNVVINNAFIAGRTITVDMPQLGASIDFTGCTGSPTVSFSVNNQQIFGSLTFVTGVTPSGANTLVFAGRGSFTVTSAGATFTQQWQLQAPTGTYTLQDAFICSRSVANSLNLTNGTFVDNGQTVSISGASGSLNLTVNGVLTKTGAWSIAATAAATFWSVVSTATFSDTSTITLTATTSNTRTFAGGGKTYGTLTYTVAGSTGQLTLTGSNTFGTVNFSDITNARSLAFTNGTTTTITGALNVNGTSGKLMSMVSTSPGTAWNLSGTFVNIGNVQVNFCTITDSHASGGATWSAFSSTNGGGNTGWNFVTVTLAAKAAASASTTASVSVGKQVSGSMPAAASATATIIGNRGLSAKAPSSASTKATVIANRGLSAKAASSASATAVVYANRGLSAKAPSSASCTATIIGNRGMSGSLPSASSCTATAIGNRGVSSSSPASASCTATIIGNRGVSSSSAAAASCTGTPRVNRGMSATAPTAASCTASSFVNRRVSGALPAAAGATGALGIARAVAGSAPSSAGLTGALGGVAQVAGSLPAAASITSGLAILRGLTAKAPSSASSKATVGLRRGVSAKALSSASIFGTASSLYLVSGRAPGAASARATLGLRRQLSTKAAAAAWVKGSITHVFVGLLFDMAIEHQDATLVFEKEDSTLVFESEDATIDMIG